MVRRLAEGETGFTLVEFLVSTALMLLLFSTIVLYHKVSFDLWKANNSKTEIQQQARIALDRLLQDLERAESLYIKRGVDSWRKMRTEESIELKEQVRLKIVLPEPQGNGHGEVYYYRLKDTLIRSFKEGHNPIAQNISVLEVTADKRSGLLHVILVASLDDCEISLMTSVYSRNTP
jgi:type II secretory pathway component PulJ